MKMDKKKTITIFACVVIGLLIVSYVVMQSKTLESPNESNTETTVPQTFGNDSENISSQSKLDMKTALEIAKSDSKVQEMLDGREFNVMSLSYGQSDGEIINVLVIQIEGEIYTISIGENNTVLSAGKFDKSLINKH
ncbi:MAG: hypothetical protein KAV25_01390 [Methanophagales archaeon]|nr:hypothetical protein [Methanophagales archaeon]